MTAQDPRSLLPALSREASQRLAPLRREIGHVFSELSHGMGAREIFRVPPHMDLCQTADEIEWTVDLPGLQEKDLRITLEDDFLTVSGERGEPNEDKPRTYSLAERPTGVFSRSVRLPAGVDPARIVATLSDGVLTVTMPRPQGHAAARTIPIRTGTA